MNTLRKQLIARGTKEMPEKVVEERRINYQWTKPSGIITKGDTLTSCDMD